MYYNIFILNIYDSMRGLLLYICREFLLYFDIWWCIIVSLQGLVITLILIWGGWSRLCVCIYIHKKFDKWSCHFLIKTSGASYVGGLPGIRARFLNSSSCHFLTIIRKPKRKSRSPNRTASAYIVHFFNYLHYYFRFQSIKLQFLSINLIMYFILKSLIYSSKCERLVYHFYTIRNSCITDQTFPQYTIQNKYFLQRYCHWRAVG